MWIILDVVTVWLMMSAVEIVNPEGFTVKYLSNMYGEEKTCSYGLCRVTTELMREHGI